MSEWCEHIKIGSKCYCGDKDPFEDEWCYWKAPYMNPIPKEVMYCQFCGAKRPEKEKTLERILHDAWCSEHPSSEGFFTDNGWKKEAEAVRKWAVEQVEKCIVNRSASCLDKDYVAVSKVIARLNGKGGE